MRAALAASATALLLLGAPAAGAADEFPPGFLWGTAISGFQTEAGQGRNADPGSDWYVWTHDPGNIAEGIVSGDLPEDGPGHWRLYRRDLDLAADQLNNNAFRLSIEWSRIFPRSTEGVDVGAELDEADLKRLDRLADQRAVHHYRNELAAAARRGITPFLTLHHWSIPTWLHDPVGVREALAGRGINQPLPELEAAGWLDPATVGEFEKLSAYLAWKLGDRVDYWNTLNEPLVQVTFGYVNIPGFFGAFWPPGVFSFTAAITALLDLERANTVAYDAVKRFDEEDADGDGEPALAGPVMNMIAFTPSNPSSPADVEASEHADYLYNRWFLNAAVEGDVDANADGVVSAGETAVHPPKADFVGVNYYLRGRVTALPNSLTPLIPILDFLPATGYANPSDPSLPPCPTTCSELGAEIYPEGFRQVIDTAAGYGLPIYVTENGIADGDDDQRPAYLSDHLRQMLLAIDEDGADVRGYFHWSLTDNFEWVYGYGPKFGLYSFDPRTLERTPRPSARLYAEIAGENALP